MKSIHSTNQPLSFFKYNFQTLRLILGGRAWLYPMRSFDFISGHFFSRPTMPSCAFSRIRSVFVLTGKSSMSCLATSEFKWRSSRLDTFFCNARWDTPEITTEQIYLFIFSHNQVFLSVYNTGLPEEWNILLPAHQVKGPTNAISRLSQRQTIYFTSCTPGEGTY